MGDLERSVSAGADTARRTVGDAMARGRADVVVIADTSIEVLERGTVDFGLLEQRRLLEIRMLRASVR